MAGFVDDDPRARRPHPAGGESRTRQSDALETDINAIVAKYRATGIVPQAPGTARYGDFASGLDYKTALDKVKAAEADFWDLPVEIRNECQNDPGVFLDKVMNPVTHDELVEQGLDEGRDPTLPDPNAVVEAPEEPAQ